MTSFFLASTRSSAPSWRQSRVNNNIDPDWAEIFYWAQTMRAAFTHHPCDLLRSV